MAQVAIFKKYSIRKDLTLFYSELKRHNVIIYYLATDIPRVRKR